MLTASDSALVLIDVQGKLSETMHDKTPLFESMKTMLKGARVLEIPVLWLEQIPEKLGPTRPEIAELLTGQSPMAKVTFSACGHPPFMAALHRTGRRKVILMGIEAHICVYQTAMDLLDKGFGVHVLVDAIGSRTPVNKAVGIEKMVSAGARPTTVETVLFEIMKQAGGPRFRDIINIIKS